MRSSVRRLQEGPAMINKVSIRNFKCLRNIQVDLERFTIFVGANASGKSSILQAMDLLCRSFRDASGNVELELSQSVSRGSNDPIELAGQSGVRSYRYRPRTAATRGNRHLTGQPW